MEKHVPSKLSKGKRSLPWITADIKRKMRKRDKLFSKARKTSLSADWKAYKAYRNNVTKPVRNSHHSYINDVIGNNLTQNPKSFWSYVKLNKTENLGYSALSLVLSTNVVYVKTQQKHAGIKHHDRTKQ